VDVLPISNPFYKQTSLNVRKGVEVKNGTVGGGTVGPDTMAATDGGCSLTARVSVSSTLEGVTAAGRKLSDAACT